VLREKVAEFSSPGSTGIIKIFENLGFLRFSRILEFFGNDLLKILTQRNNRNFKTFRNTKIFRNFREFLGFLRIFMECSIFFWVMCEKVAKFGTEKILEDFLVF
jgi:hypothetical protein